MEYLDLLCIAMVALLTLAMLCIDNPWLAR